MFNTSLVWYAHSFTNKDKRKHEYYNLENPASALANETALLCCAANQ